MPASALAFTLKVDEISPSLSELAEPALRRRCVQAMATVVESFAVRAFDEPSLRPTSWPARKPSKASNPLLIQSGNLRQSIHTQVLGNDAAKVGTPAVYAAVHQLGSGKKGIPARPFFPVVENQLTGNANEEIRDVVDALIGNAAGGQ
jgi:phage gpG-like protein